MPLGVNLKSREGNSQTGHRMFTRFHSLVKQLLEILELQKSMNYHQIRFHKDNLRHHPRFPLKIVSNSGIACLYLPVQALEIISAIQELKLMGIEGDVVSCLYENAI